MYKSFVRGLPLLALACAATPAMAQSNTANATGSANIIIPVSIAPGDALRFGTLGRPHTGSGTATIAPSTGTLTVDGGVDGVETVDRGAGTLTITGQPSTNISVSVPATMTLSNGTANITVSLTTSTLPTTLPVSGSDTFSVGGSMTLSSTQATGDYNGSYQVSVYYN